jgi:hypothetical protein
MINVFLNKLNLKNIDDQTFLYEILKFRWKHKKTINIKYKVSNEIPSFDDHVKNLLSGKYKVFYKILANEIPIGVVFIDNNDVNGTFVIPEFLKKAFKTYKGQKLNIQDKTLSAYIHIELFKLHPEIKVHFASVNPNNTMSVNALIENGYEHIESILAIRTENGIVIDGKWAGKQ